MTTDPATIDRASLAIASQLDLELGAYATDGTLLTIVLDALVRRGWRVTLDYDQSIREWHCLCRRDAALHRAQDRSLARAAVFAALLALRPDDVPRA